MQEKNKPFLKITDVSCLTTGANFKNTGLTLHRGKGYEVLQDGWVNVIQERKMPTLKTGLKDKSLDAKDIPVGHLAKNLKDEILVIRTTDGLVFLQSFAHLLLSACSGKYIDCGKIEIE